MRILDVDLKKALLSMTEEEREEFKNKVDKFNMKEETDNTMVKCLNTQDIQEIFKSMYRLDLVEMVNDPDLNENKNQDETTRFIPVNVAKNISKNCEQDNSSKTKKIISKMPRHKVSQLKETIETMRKSQYTKSGYDLYDDEKAINGGYSVDEVMDKNGDICEIYEALEAREEYEKQLDEQAYGKLNERARKGLESKNPIVRLWYEGTRRQIRSFIKLKQAFNNKFNGDKNTKLLPEGHDAGKNEASHNKREEFCAGLRVRPAQEANAEFEKYIAERTTKNVGSTMLNETTLNAKNVGSTPLNKTTLNEKYKDDDDQSR